MELVLAHTSDAQGRGEAEQRGKAWKYRVRLWYFLAWGVDFAAEKTIFELCICQDPDRVGFEHIIPFSAMKKGSNKKINW